MSYSIAPDARLQFFDSNGDPLSGGLLFTYASNTTTKIATKTTSVGDASNANPIVLNPSGYTPNGVWLTDGLAYTFVLAPSTDTDPPTAPIWQEDEIVGAVGASPVTDEWNALGIAPTYVSSTSFTVPGDQTDKLEVGRRVEMTNIGGTFYGTITSSVYTSLTTVIVFLDSGALDAGLSEISYGFLKPNNSSIPPNTLVTGTYKNKIINPDFYFATYSTSSSGAGYTSLDRWYHDYVTSSGSMSRQTFVLGQTDVPNNPRYYLRNTASDSAVASAYSRVQHNIENVSTFSGETVTLSFYAKADAAKNIAIELVQDFGTGGAPSADVTGIGITTVALTTSWKKYNVNISVPSITGKTLGTASDFLSINFWCTAGTDFDARTNNLGHRAITFDLSRAQLERGAIVTDFEERPLQIELALCQRYHWRGLPANRMTFSSYSIAAAFSWPVKFPVTMRAVPTLSSDFTGATLNSINAPAVDEATVDGCRLYTTSTAVIALCTLVFGAGNFIDASAELS